MRRAIQRGARAVHELHDDVEEAAVEAEVAFVDDALLVLVAPFRHQRVQLQHVLIVEQAARVELVSDDIPARLQGLHGLRHVLGVGEGALEGIARERRQPFVDGDGARPGTQRGEVAVRPFDRDALGEAGEPLAHGREGLDLGLGVLLGTAHRAAPSSCS